jgi:putative ABC transport system ATP-binding protein
MFKELNEVDGITVIMVTHDADVARYARRIIHIHDGVIVNGAAGHTQSSSGGPVSAGAQPGGAA